MTPERIEELRLTAPDEAAIATLLGRCFGTDFGGRSCFMQRHHVRLVLRDPGIVGHIGLTFRHIRQGDRLIPILGVADVATDPDRRGQGIAAQLVQAVIAEGRASPADFILLFGTAGLYTGAGFRSVSNHLRAVDMTDAITRSIIEAPNDSLMVLPMRQQQWDDATPLDMLGHLF